VIFLTLRDGELYTVYPVVSWLEESEYRTANAYVRVSYNIVSRERGRKNYFLNISQIFYFLVQKSLPC